MRCPICTEDGIEIMDMSEKLLERSRRRILTAVFFCPACGRTFTRIYRYMQTREIYLGLEREDVPRGTQKKEHDEDDDDHDNDDDDAPGADTGGERQS